MLVLQDAFSHKSLKLDYNYFKWKLKGYQIEISLLRYLEVNNSDGLFELTASRRRLDV